MKSKIAVCVLGGIIVFAFIIVFGYLGFRGKRLNEPLRLTYTDEITVENGQQTVKNSGVEFINEDSTMCKFRVIWGNAEDEYPFISMVKVIAPSGKVVTYITGDSGDGVMEIPLEEQGAYRVESDYFFDGIALREEVKRINPEGEQIELDEDGSFDGFVFQNKDGQWKQTYEMTIVNVKN